MALCEESTDGLPSQRASKAGLLCFLCCLHEEAVKQTIGLLLRRVCDTIWLMPIRFWRKGDGREVRTLNIVVGGGVACEILGTKGLLLTYNTWSNSLIIGIYPAVNVLMSPSYTKYSIYIIVYLSFNSSNQYTVIWSPCDTLLISGMPVFSDNDACVILLPANNKNSRVNGGQDSQKNER